MSDPRYWGSNRGLAPSQPQRTRWSIFHDRSATLYGSDNTAPCASCGGTVHGFKESQKNSDGTTLFDVFCYSCHMLSVISVAGFDNAATTLSAAHRKRAEEEMLPKNN